jgi:hypothetical protein
VDHRPGPCSTPSATEGLRCVCNRVRACLNSGHGLRFVAGREGQERVRGRCSASSSACDAALAPRDETRRAAGTRAWDVVGRRSRGSPAPSGRCAASRRDDLLAQALVPAAQPVATIQTGSNVRPLSRVNHA